MSSIQYFSYSVVGNPVYSIFTYGSLPEGYLCSPSIISVHLPSFTDPCYDTFHCNIVDRSFIYVVVSQHSIKRRYRFPTYVSFSSCFIRRSLLRELHIQMCFAGFIQDTPVIFQLNSVYTKLI